jgi:hypothetical protein
MRFLAAAFDCLALIGVTDQALGLGTNAPPCTTTPARAALNQLGA